MNILIRMSITAGVVIGAAVFVAIVAALLDLYLTGHGLSSISKEVVSEPAWGVHLSIADIVLLAVAALAGAITWWMIGGKHGT